MIVTDDMVATALAYLADDPHPIAVARKRATDAENTAKRIFAQVYLLAEGTVRERECFVEMNQQYQEAKTQEVRAAMELERHKARSRSAEMVIEVWRSENANARAAERVR